jgi:hypothetical protein
MVCCGDGEAAMKPGQISVGSKAYAEARRIHTAVVRAVFLVGLVGLLLPDSLHSAGGPDTLWVRTYEWAGSFCEKHLDDVVWCSDGGCLLVGTCYLDYHKHMSFTKVDSSGKVEWARTEDHTAGEFMTFDAEAAEDGGFVLTGAYSPVPGFPSDLFARKISGAGEDEWLTVLGGDLDDVGRAIYESPQGGLILLGTTESFGYGRSDIYVVRLDQGGDTLWTRTIGAGGDDTPYSISHASDGSGFLVLGWTASTDRYGLGQFFIRMDSEGDTLWTSQIDGICAGKITVSADGGYLCVGSCRPTCFSDVEMRIYSLDTDLNLLWKHTCRGRGDAYGIDVQPTSDGGCVVAGSRADSASGWGPRNACLIRLSCSGSRIWTEEFPASAESAAKGVKVCTDGSYMVAGMRHGDGTQSDAPFILRTASERPLTDTWPISLRVSSPYPNPCSEAAVFNVWVVRPASVSTSVYDVRGRLLGTPMREHADCGGRSMTMDLGDMDVASGVYYCRFQAGGSTVTRKLVVVREP